MATIKEVSILAGVSKATVSRVLSGADPVKEKTRKKVLDAVKKLDFVPNQAARALASKQSNTIGLVIFDIETAYYGPAASGIEAALRGEDRHVIIASGQGCLKGELDAVDFLIKRQVDALVLLTSYLTESVMAEINQVCPVFVMNQSYPDSVGKTVAFDNYKGGFIATDYLIKKGHTKIATITGPLRKDDAGERYRGFRDALSQHRLASVWQGEGDFSTKSGIDQMRKMLEAGVQPTGLVCANDQTAIGAINVCREYGIAVPGELAIVGFDDLDIAKYFYPPLTTVKLPLYQMSDAIAKLVMNFVYGKNYEVVSSFSPEIIIRQSA